MALVEKKVLVGLLESGMFVSRLDRDWVGTPFPFQGFHVQTDDDLELLAAFCTHVWVDVEKGKAPGQSLATLGAGPRPVFPPRGAAYRDTTSLLDEVPRAREAHGTLRQLAARIAQDVRQGKRLSPGEVREAMEPLVESLLRNADAMFWMLGLLRRDDYSYSHAVNCSALAAAFGRHLALPREVLVELATGGFLLDIGKATLPDDLVAGREPLPPDAISVMRGHVEAGLRLVADAGIGGSWVNEMLAHHHERHDGSGYPAGLKGNAISLGGRMAAVIDSYDAISSDRPHRAASSRHAALQQIYRASDSLYQGEVVEQFLQCLCVYPTGSLVELTSGEVAIVMAQNQARRLRPRVMMLLDRDKKPYSPARDVDLMSLGEGKDAVEIAAALEPGAHGLDPADLFLA